MKPMYSRVLGGVIYPLAVPTFGMLLLVHVDSSAKAAEFGGLAVSFVSLFATPTTLVGNLMLLKSSGSTLHHFRRGMILPGIFLVWAVVYQTGLWDRLT